MSGGPPDEKNIFEEVDSAIVNEGVSINDDNTIVEAPLPAEGEEKEKEDTIEEKQEEGAVVADTESAVTKDAVVDTEDKQEEGAVDTEEKQEEGAVVADTEEKQEEGVVVADTETSKATTTDKILIGPSAPSSEDIMVTIKGKEKNATLFHPQNTHDVIDILTGRFKLKQLPGKPPAGNKHWESRTSKSPSLGWFFSYSRSSAEDKSREDEVISKLKQQLITKIPDHEQIEKELKKQFEDIGLGDDSALFIDYDLFNKNLSYSSIHFDDPTYDIKDPMADDDQSETSSLGEGATTAETKSLPNPKEGERTTKMHDIIHSYLNFTNVHNGGDNLRNEFHDCLKETKEYCNNSGVSRDTSGYKLLDELTNIEDIKSTDYNNLLSELFNFGNNTSSPNFKEPLPTEDDRDASTPDMQKQQATEFIMDLFVFAFKKAKNIEQQWVVSARKLSEGINTKGQNLEKPIETQTGGMPRRNQGEMVPGVDYQFTEEEREGLDSDENVQGLEVAGIPARPNLIVTIVGIMISVLGFLALVEQFSLLRQAFISFNDRVTEFRDVNGETGYGMFTGTEGDDGENNDTCTSHFSWVVLYEFIRNYFYDGFQESLNELQGIAQERLLRSARTIANAASSSAAQTWATGTVTFLINTVTGTVGQAGIAAARTQLNGEVQLLFAEQMLNFNTWMDNFNLLIRSSANALVIGYSGLQFGTMIILNQVSPYTVNRYSVMASGTAFTTSLGSGGSVFGATTVIGQTYGTVRGVYNTIMRNRDEFINAEAVNAPPPSEGTSADTTPSESNTSTLSALFGYSETSGSQPLQRRFIARRLEGQSIYDTSLIEYEDNQGAVSTGEVEIDVKEGGPKED